MGHPQSEYPNRGPIPTQAESGLEWATRPSGFAGIKKPPAEGTRGTEEDLLCGTSCLLSFESRFLVPTFRINRERMGHPAV